MDKAGLANGADLSRYRVLSVAGDPECTFLATDGRLFGASKDGVAVFTTDGRLDQSVPISSMRRIEAVSSDALSFGFTQYAFTRGVTEMYRLVFMPVRP